MTYHVVAALLDVRLLPPILRRTTMSKKEIIGFGETPPIVRLEKITIENFRGVSHGEIELNPYKNTNPYGVSADILGLYGQNGSGKSACIEALQILKVLMSGSELEDPFLPDEIKNGTDHAQFEFVFDIKSSESNDVLKAVYSFCISAKDANEASRDMFKAMSEATDALTRISDEKFTAINPENFKQGIRVYNESISFSGVVDEKLVKLQKFIDTSTTEIPFGPATKHKYFINTATKEDMISLEVNKRVASKNSQSFIFMPDTLQLFFSKQKEDSIYLEAIYFLYRFAINCFNVVNTQHATGDPRGNMFLAMYTLSPNVPGTYLINTIGFDTYDVETFTLIHDELERISDVLEQIIPGLRLELRESTSSSRSDGKEFKDSYVVIKRDGLVLPIRSESDGIRKIISILGLYIAAYNDPSVTIAIDELDAGVFEYLLGELLQIFQEHGKGQIIFTSHNLRPLELLKKEYVCFTTTNKENAYIRLKHIGATNNLRNVYIREILLNEQDEELYRTTKEYKIVAALRKVGAK